MNNKGLFTYGDILTLLCEQCVFDVQINAWVSAHAGIIAMSLTRAIKENVSAEIRGL